MEKTDARPPPDVCDLIERVLRNNPDLRDLRDFAETHPDDFALLLHHSSTCSTCLQKINQAFPEGFVTEEESKQLDEGVAKAEEVLDRELAERAAAEEFPEEGLPGLPPRGDG